MRQDVALLVGETLTRAQRRVLPVLRTQVDRLPLQQRRWVAFHLGWSEATGKPVTGKRAGKGLRPALVYAAAEAFGETPEELDEVAAAVELVHNFCILHDDVIDQDRERRGRPTVWAEFGMSAGVLSGDALLALALGCLDDTNLARRLCQAVQDLVRGEALDVEYEARRDLTTEDYLLMGRLKTGSLMGAACALGAACPEVVTRMDRFGRSLGLAFQIADDLLGIFAVTRRSPANPSARISAAASGQLSSATHCRWRTAPSVPAPHRRHQRQGLIQLKARYGRCAA
jgi:geranylgeranyl diphosphate synthase type I